MKHNAYIYCRTASASQSENRAIKEQEKRCRAFAEKNGFNVIGTVFDSGVSGVSTKRKGFDYLLLLLRELPEPCVVLIDGVGRLARSWEAHTQLEAKIEKAGATIILANGVK